MGRDSLAKMQYGQRTVGSIIQTHRVLVLSPTPATLALLGKTFAGKKQDSDTAVAILCPKIVRHFHNRSASDRVSFTLTTFSVVWAA